MHHIFTKKKIILYEFAKPNQKKCDQETTEFIMKYTSICLFNNEKKKKKQPASKARRNIL
jgi:hypothetical protein